MNFSFEDRDFTPGLLLLEDDFGFLRRGADLSVTVRKGDVLRVKKSRARAVIEYVCDASFFRAAGLLLERLDEDEFEISEKENFKTDGVMFDVSQGNAAPSSDTVEYILRKMAAMGLNMLMLYCEDSYVIPQYRYFGYMRARYGCEELRALDDYAYALGIEIVPCIQTLAHLSEALKWDELGGIRQDSDTLLVGEDETYAFIDAAITAASAPFRSRRIHIGMDEAWELGMGEYYRRHGAESKFDIMCAHLDRVNEICRSKGLSPMMWSDMFFRAAASDGGYYSPDARITPSAALKMPSDVDYIYWDYYHTDREFYDSFIAKFEPTGRKPIFAGGVWSWYGYAVNWGMTYSTMLPALRSCVENGINEVFLTVWGDNGAESHILANLPALSLFAEYGYGNFDFEAYKKRFEFCCGASFDAFYDLRLPDEIPGVPEGNPEQCNCSKYLMWNDILSGLFDCNMRGIALSEHYAETARRILPYSRGEGRICGMFRLYYLLCRALEYKAEAGMRLYDAYHGGKAQLEECLCSYLPELKKRVRELHAAHRELWLETYKHHGFDVLDMRYAAVETRIDTAEALIIRYLAGALDRIEELEDERLPYDGKSGIPRYRNHYGRICSASDIASEH